jgi:uncharacterized protein (TIGR02246 family)
MTNTREVDAEADAAIRWLIARYCQVIDDRDYDAAASLFTDDARMRIVDHTIEGRSAIREWMETIPADVFHLVTNVVTSNGSHGDVHAVSDAMTGMRSDGQWTVMALGRYHDTMVGSGRDLRFKQRLFTVR